MKNKKTTKAVLAGVLAAPLLFSSVIPAIAANDVANGVIVIRGTETVAPSPGGPVVIRGMPSVAPQARAIDKRLDDRQPTTIARGGEVLWLVNPDGTITACTVRGSSVVVEVQGNVIVCASARID